MDRCRVTEETNDHHRQEDALALTEQEEAQFLEAVELEINEQIDNENEDYIDVLVDNIDSHLCHFSRSMPTNLPKFEDAEVEQLRAAYNASLTLITEIGNIVRPLAESNIRDTF